MEISQSPTQSNGDRSYERYESPVSEDIAELESPVSSPGPVSVDGDTGQVEFNLPTAGLQSPSFDRLTTAGEATPMGPPLRSDGQNHPHNAEAVPPETPALPRNPFAAKLQAPLLGGSQLFKHTQYSSAIKNQPTTWNTPSSRPSPNNLQDFSTPHIMAISSPNKSLGLTSSSPYARTSSPPVVPPVSSQRLDEVDTPRDGVTTDSPQAVCDSPVRQARRGAVGQGPLANYEPMEKSQARREKDTSATTSDESEAEQGRSQRQRQVRLKKEAGRRQLSSIFLKGSLPEEFEVPSTHKSQRDPRMSPQEDVPDDRLDSAAADNDDDDDDDDDEGIQTVEDSQEVTHKVPSDWLYDDIDLEESTPAYDGVPEARLPQTSSASPVRTRAQRLAQSTRGEEGDDIGEAIPETSPVVKLPPGGNTEFNGSTQKSAATMSSLSGRSSRSIAARSAKDNLRHGFLGSSGEGKELAESSPVLPSMKAQFPSDEVIPASSSPALGTRPQRKYTRKTARLSTSSLSSLSSTPVLSDKTTPATEESGGNPLQTDATPKYPSSPAASRVQRRDALKTLPPLETAIIEAKVPGRVTRHRSKQDLGSMSSARSRSQTPIPEQGSKVTRTAATKRGRTASKAQPIAQPTSREHSVQGGRLFEGMAFAISFVARKPGETSDQYEERMQFAEVVAKKIQQAGGRLLSEGFSELFEKPSIQDMSTSQTSPTSPAPPSPALQLVANAAETGFTALVADGHSRKAKYMQALALGLPCLAPRWVTTCLDKGKLVDWTPFLLCAGQSTFLGDAIRSRILAPYNADTAKLASVLGGRPQFLEGSKILIVLRKADKGKRNAYLFLAQVLGGSLSRVATIDEARTQLKAAEDLDQPYDWVYVDDKAERDEIFGHVKVAESNSKKRKRRGASVSIGPDPKKTRTLSDEGVIQSLILGRLLGEDELA